MLDFLTDLADRYTDTPDATPEVSVFRFLVRQGL